MEFAFGAAENVAVFTVSSAPDLILPQWAAGQASVLRPAPETLLR